MTPIIIKTTDGIHPDITLAELNEIIERVSKEAFDDGYKEAQKNKGYTLWYPPVYNPPVIHWDDFVYRPNPYEITCDTNSNITINSTGEVIYKNDNA